MPFDAHTTRQLVLQGRRMQHALHTIPPDRKEARLIQDRVDQILDNRPRVTAIAPDGEILWSNQSPLVLDQGTPLPPAPPDIVNDTGRPEPVLSAEQWRRTFAGPDDDGLAGVGA